MEPKWNVSKRFSNIKFLKNLEQVEVIKDIYEWIHFKYAVEKFGTYLKNSMK